MFAFLGLTHGASKTVGVSASAPHQRRRRLRSGDGGGALTIAVGIRSGLRWIGEALTLGAAGHQSGIGV